MFAPEFFSLLRDCSMDEAAIKPETSRLIDSILDRYVPKYWPNAKSIDTGRPVARPAVVFQASGSMKRKLGFFHTGFPFQITLSKALLSSDRFLESVLVHELIHYYEYWEKYGKTGGRIQFGNRVIWTWDSHGADFEATRRKINSDVGFEMVVPRESSDDDRVNAGLDLKALKSETRFCMGVVWISASSELSADSGRFNVAWASKKTSEFSDFIKNAMRWLPYANVSGMTVLGYTFASQDAVFKGDLRPFTPKGRRNGFGIYEKPAEKAMVVRRIKEAGDGQDPWYEEFEPRQVPNR